MKALIAGSAGFSGLWVWALLASPDSKVVLDGEVRLPLTGLGVPAGVFFIAAPIFGLALLSAARIRGRGRGRPWIAVLLPALILNAQRCLKLHDPALSYITVGMAVAGTALAAWSWAASRPFRNARVSARNILEATGIAVTAGIEVFMIIFLIPWALRGDLPGNLNNYPFGPAVRRLVFANLAGLERPQGSGRSLRGLRLEGADLSGSALAGADLREARLYRARLHKAILDRADLRDAVLTEAGMSFVSLRDADLSGAELNGMFSVGADLRGAVLRGVRHHVQRLFYADGRGLDATSAEMASAQCNGADFGGAVFRGAVLTGANLIRTGFEGADLSGANLAKADLEEALFRDAVLDGADLRGAVHLKPEALAEARSLRGIVLDPPLLEELKRLGFCGKQNP